MSLSPSQDMRTATFALFCMVHPRENMQETVEVDAAAHENLRLLETAAASFIEPDYMPYGFQLYDRDIRMVDGKPVMGEEYNISPEHYLGRYMPLQEAINQLGHLPALLRLHRSKGVTNVFHAVGTEMYHALSGGVNYQYDYLLSPHIVFGHSVLIRNGKKECTAITVPQPWIRHPEKRRIAA